MRELQLNFSYLYLMFRTIITPKESKLWIDLPEALVGKSVEVLAFEIEPTKDFIEDEQWKRAVSFWDAHAVDMSNFKFNREEANER
jgi:hypothetical protein